MNTTWTTLHAGACSPAAAARLMRCSVSEATRQLTAVAIAQSRHERTQDRAATAVSNSGAYEALHLWGTGKLGRGVSLEKSGDITFAHMAAR
ncbi:MAG: hypothetical protein JWQ02_167 [Capsulimonas sp.]|nr:hypothetical protein [Capsulimonas sp.]